MVQISKKDKSLIMLILAGLVVVYALFSGFSYLINFSTFHNADVNKLFAEDEKNKTEQWFNVERPLEVSDLKGRIVLLDFWTYACVNCAQTLQQIKEWEKQFGSKLVVIGVHSGKFENEKNFAEIKKAIIRNDITHPVINDSNLRIWNSFEVKAWPTLVLLNPNGNVEKVYVGESEAEQAKSGIKRLIAKYKYELNRSPLPMALEKTSIDGNVLSFPTKLEYAADFSYKSHHTPALFISNTGKNNILVTSLSGDVMIKIGSGSVGMEDGSFDVASFNAPQGLLYRAGKLYVADTGNHALREIDFKTGKVTTLVGSGQRGSVLSDQEIIEARSFELTSPTELEFFPNLDNIVIANSGTHQLLSYSVNKGTITLLAGSGAEGISDGKYPNNSLAQTADLSVFNKKLYFLDSESSSLRVLDEAGEIKTLVGKGLFDFGLKNGDRNEALMQHPLGLMVDDTGAYISDSFNHVIRKYDLTSGNLSLIAGSKKSGNNLGSSGSTEFDQPEGIVSVLNNFYIADANNNRIVVLNRGNFSSSLLDVMPPLKLPKEGFVQYLPNLKKLPDLAVKADAEITVKIDVKSGLKINEMGPSFINLLEIAGDEQVNLIAVADWREIKNKTLKFPQLSSKKNYVLQGVIYYCEDKPNSLCYIKSYEQKLDVKSGEANGEVVVAITN